MQKELTPEYAGIFADISVNTVYIMGASFVLGSLFTLLLLLVLDFVRSTKEEKKP